MSMLPVDANSIDEQDHLPVIDALRGYAILLVIGVHSLAYAKELIWPFKRILLLGFYGVQLFFMASAMTLLMSWYRSKDRFSARSGKFLMRRFFRIAPLYYLAVPFYWLAYQMQVSDFSFELLFASLLFYNAWSPYLIPTVPGWTPVPGGWSIGVEFCFYLVFPVLAATITSSKRAGVFFLAAVTVMIFASAGGMETYPQLSVEERSNFLYFWPLNQLVIFSLGFVLYYCVKNEAVTRWVIQSRITADKSSVLVLIALFALSFYGPRKFFDWTSFTVPTHLLISLVFLPWAVVLVTKPIGKTINPFVVNLGKVSFSAYIFHFAVLRFVGMFFNRFWPMASDGIYSIPFIAAILATTLTVTWYVSSLTYRCVEQPFINIGRSITRRVFLYKN